MKNKEMKDVNSDDSDVYMYDTCCTTHYCDEALRDYVQQTLAFS